MTDVFVWITWCDAFFSSNLEVFTLFLRFYIKLLRIKFEVLLLLKLNFTVTDFVSWWKKCCKCFYRCRRHRWLTKKRWHDQFIENIPWQIIFSHTDGAKRRTNNSSLLFNSIKYFFSILLLVEARTLSMFQNITQSS